MRLIVSIKLFFKSCYLRRKKLFFSILLMSLIACNQVPNGVKQVFELAGENKKELQAVIDHYSIHKEDSLKLFAARYLISNSMIHSFKISYFEDKNGEKVEFYPPEYGSLQKANSARDSLMNHTNYISNVVSDCAQLKSGHLINHIDKLFEIWKSVSWFNEVGFKQFIRNILPYRVQNEPLSSWADVLNERYAALIDTIPNKSILESAKLINSAMAEDIRYGHYWMGGIGAQSVLELLESKSGMCDDLSAFGVCAMRACGIPAAMDFTMWTRRDFGHSWAVVFDEDGKAWSFGPGEQNPGDHIKIFQVDHRKLSKVYRRTFEMNKSGLWSQVEDIRSIPPFLRQLNIMDVTSEYVPVFDIPVPVDESYNDKMAYICVYNLNRWRPIFWGNVDNAKATFLDMGADILYIVAEFDGMRVIPITDPFLFRSNNQIEFLNGQRSENKGIKIANTFLGFKYLKENDKCQLYQWDGMSWGFIEEVVMQKDSFISFSKANGNSLYKIDSFDRPFTVSGNNVEIW